MRTSCSAPCLASTSGSMPDGDPCPKGARSTRSSALGTGFLHLLEGNRVRARPLRLPHGARRLADHRREGPHGPTTLVALPVASPPSSQLPTEPEDTETKHGRR